MEMLAAAARGMRELIMNCHSGADVFMMKPVDLTGRGGWIAGPELRHAPCHAGSGAPCR
ncbi:hypothetical protein [Sphingomonas abietis]|uniref:Response regulator n=1 Tax=Sphingomonas abietis TaxID=3012344 RepID=A0ABY7NKI5_9SPHN|nr:hypothetical protein [Sphingomonas abietis]WBO22045.1 hypothetical protein PBT88_18090 [Sphingomonas abietis]